MVKKSLTDKLKTGLYAGLAAGALSLTGCGSGGSGSTEPPPVQRISQTAVLVNSVDIDYCATLENVSSATRKISRDGSEYETKTITQSGCETLEDLTKGNYKFDLTAPNVTPHSIEREVPEHEKIAYWKKDIDGNEDIHKGVLVDGVLTNVKRLTTDPGQDLEPAWSHDGRLAFTSNRDGNIRLYTMDADGSNQEVLTPPNIINYAKDAAWSPDNLKIAFAYIDYNLNSSGIGLINPDGTGFNKLIEKPFDGTVSDGISWSPDGSKIFYDMFENNNWDIFSVKSDGTGLPENITNNLYNENLPNVSPLGDRLAFVTNQFGGEFSGLEVMSIDVDGTDVRRVTNTVQMEVDATYSNDGTKLLYSRWLISIDDWQMFLSNSDGTGEVEVQSGRGRYATFKPNLNL